MRNFKSQLPISKWWIGLAALAAVLALGVGLWGLDIFVQQDRDEAWARIRETGVLAVATDASYPPFSAIDVDGNIFGFEVDLARALAQRLSLRAGREVQASFDPITYDALLSSLVSGRSDLVISAFVPQMDRLKEVSYTSTYFVGGTVAVVRSGSGGTSFDSEAPLPWATGKTLAVEYGSGGDVLARQWSRRTTGVTVRSKPTALEALAALESGEAEAALVDLISAYDYIGAHPALTLAGPPLEPEPYVMAVRVDSTELLTALQDALAALQQDGTLSELRVKWFGEAARNQ